MPSWMPACKGGSTTCAYSHLQERLSRKGAKALSSFQRKLESMGAYQCQNRLAFAFFPAGGTGRAMLGRPLNWRNGSGNTRMTCCLVSRAVFTGYGRFHATCERQRQKPFLIGRPIAAILLVRIEGDSSRGRKRSRSSRRLLHRRERHRWSPRGKRAGRSAFSRRRSLRATP